MKMLIDKGRKLMLKIFTILLTMSIFFNCDSTLESITECVKNYNLTLPDKDFKDGKVGVVYQDKIIASVDGQVNNNNYGYRYDIEGLPAGLKYVVSVGTILLEGVPTETGSFEIKVSLGVYPLNDVSFTCNENTEKEYTININ